MTEHICTFPNCAEPAPVFRAKMESLRRVNAELVAALDQIAGATYTKEATVALARAALRSATDTVDLPSVNWKDGKAYNYCPECGRQEPIRATIETKDARP